MTGFLVVVGFVACMMFVVNLIGGLCELAYLIWRSRK